MRIAICDDDRVTLDNLKSIILQELQINNFICDEVDVFDSGYELLEEYSKKSYDAIFLDIRMPEISGFEIAAALREISFKTFIIFVTTENELVFSSFDFQPFHFIRKYPSEYLKIQLKNVIKKLSRHIRQNESIVLELAFSEKEKICVGDILYISSEKNYLVYHFLKSEIRVRGKLAETADKYSAYDFIRVHNCFLVNMKNIRFIDYPNDEIRLKDNSIISIGRSYKKALNEQYTLYLRSLR
ncbi:MAG: LytTR family DNA-binding domain-containing protein [Oscillospiraceae bacterium]|nr:LytTR family DNA-binding domain-containing protein [Oscillospiraceae bacterium]